MTFCDKCGKAFGNIAESRAHIASCNPKPCKHCNGTGNDPNVNPADNGGIAVACPGCHGSGGEES